MNKTIFDFPMFRQARLISQLSEFDQRYKVGAVISRNNQPLAFGHNKLKTHAKFPNAFSIHAEMAVLMRNPKTEKATIWVYRETANKVPAISMPCKLCLPLIVESGIKRVYYSQPEYPYYGVIEL